MSVPPRPDCIRCGEQAFITFSNGDAFCIPCLPRYQQAIKEADGLADLVAKFQTEVESLGAALREIRDHAGAVCPAYETCDHQSCRGSHVAWEIADAALKHFVD